MAWQSLGSAELRNGGSLMGWCTFEYDDSSSEPRSVRLRISGASGAYFYVDFRDVYVAGNYVGSWSNLTQNSGVFWSGSVSGGRNVTASWTNPWYAGTQYPSVTGYLPAGGTTPTGLSTTLGTVGTDWAEITVNLSSYGSPSDSANRYIEAAILGSSSYGNPYKYKTKKAVNTNTFTIDNSGSGNLTIVPNTQYHYGGYASNTVKSTSTVTGTFVTLPAKPTLTAIDQGHGQIDFAVAHATEGSAKTVAEEYSTDGGTTWTTITGGAFTLTLATQTEVTVRRFSDAGESSEIVTVTPTFTNGIYASVSGQSKKVEHIYIPGQSRTLVGASINLGPIFVRFNEQTFVRKFNEESAFRRYIAMGWRVEKLAVRAYKVNTTTTKYQFLIKFNESAIYGRLVEVDNDLDAFLTQSAMWGVSILSNLALGTLYESAVTASYAVTEALSTKKVRKVYASVDGKSTLVFEDVS